MWQQHQKVEQRCKVMNLYCYVSKLGIKIAKIIKGGRLQTLAGAH